VQSLKTLRGLPSGFKKEFTIGEPTEEEGYEFDFAIGLFNAYGLGDIDKYLKLQVYQEKVNGSGISSKKYLDLVPCTQENINNFEEYSLTRFPFA
jgi:hypothetical protein